MGTGIFKTVVIAISAALSTLLYTKKRLKKEGKLRAIHSKANDGHHFTKRN